MNTPLRPGDVLAHYRIAEQIGEGGMGVVFRAEDSRLGREVALKVLPHSLVADPERRARFEREARLLAQLNHPNIAQIHGFEAQEEHHALVMELVEGPTLDERLARGALPVEEALALARQIAEALEAAHEKGIVHRDLKPQNVKVPPEGRVKVLDFGLAKALEPAAGDSGSSDLANSPTLTKGVTALGVILGTAAYMSPEQAKGRLADKRSDIWAFGVLLFEMLAGRRLFAGETVAETLAEVLRAEPDWAALPAGLPDSLRNLLRRCLERDPHQRLHDVADARIVLDELAEGWETTPDGDTTVPAPKRRWVGWGVAALLGAFAMLGLLKILGPEASAPASTYSAHFRQITFLGGAEEAPALAPDGESFAYVKAVDGQKDIFLQRVGGSNAVNLTAACELDDDEPSFSPDGRRIAYRSECAGGGIFVMGALGESVRKVTGEGHDPAWSADGRELAVADEKLGSPFSRRRTSQLWAVQIETGERRLLSARDAVDPSWSPDGGRIAFWGLQEESSQRDLFTVAADGSQAEVDAAVPVLADPAVDWSPIWAPDGRALLFASTRGGTMNIWRVTIDPRTGRAEGKPVPITAPSSWVGYLSASADGRRLAFVDRNVRSTIRVARFDPEAGEIEGAAEPLPIGTLEVHDRIAVSGDGAVLFSSSGFPQHLVLAEPSGSLVRLTDGLYRDRQASFSPDGTWIAFQTDRWPSSLALIRADGSGLRQVETELSQTVWFPIFSPDGEWLALSSTRGGSRLPLSGTEPSGPAEPLPSPGDDLIFSSHAFSPNGDRLLGRLLGPAGTVVGAAIFDLATGEYRKIADGHIGSTSFLPDGRRVLLTSSSRLQIVDLGTGEARDLVVVAEGSELVAADLFPDGSRLAWHERTDESDLWLADFENAEAQ